jgi:hypothetical protein
MKPNFPKLSSGAAYLADVAADVRRLNSNSTPDTKTGDESQSLVTSAATGKFQTFHVNGSMPTAGRAVRNFAFIKQQRKPPHWRERQTCHFEFSESP